MFQKNREGEREKEGKRDGGILLILKTSTIPTTLQVKKKHDCRIVATGITKPTSKLNKIKI